MELEFSLTVKVANHIRRLIELQELRPGDLVPLEQIEEALSVSRTPAREAIRQLELEHLVVIEPGRGAYISPIIAGEIVDLYLLREHLESQAVRMSAGGISRYDLHNLRDNVEEYAAQKRCPERLSILDREFHFAIFESCGNRYLEKTLKSLRIRMRLLHHPAYHNFRRTECALAEHQRILDALERRDADQAEEAMRQHIQNAWKERLLQEGYDEVVKPG